MYLPIAGLLLGGAYYWYQSRPLKPTFQGKSSCLNQTDIVADLEVPLQPGRSAIWCISLELGWRKLMSEVLSGPIQFCQPDELVDRLNVSTATWQDLPAHLLSLTCDQPTPKVYRVQGSMTASVPFTSPFFHLSEGRSFDGDGSFKYFGIRHNDHLKGALLRRQVSVLHHSNESGTFIIDPCIHTKPFRLVLASCQPETTLGRSIAKVKTLCSQSQPRPLDQCEILLMPYQSWDIQHHFGGLSQQFAPPLNGKLEVEQRLKFSLDRSGARIYTDISLIAIFGRARKFCFDHPFLIFIEARSTGQVIFASWVANSELLVKA